MAKSYCQDNDLRMSVWVTELTDAAIARAPNPPQTPPPNVAPVPTRKIFKWENDEYDVADVANLFGAPPFWENN